MPFYFNFFDIFDFNKESIWDVIFKIDYIKLGLKKIRVEINVYICLEYFKGNNWFKISVDVQQISYPQLIILVKSQQYSIFLFIKSIFKLNSDI